MSVDFLKSLFYKSYVLNFQIDSNIEIFVKNLAGFLKKKKRALKEVDSNHYIFNSSINQLVGGMNLLSFSGVVSMDSNDHVNVSLKFQIGRINNIFAYFILGVFIVGISLQDFDLVKVLTFILIWLFIYNMYYQGMIKSNHKKLELFFSSLTKKAQ